MLIDITRTIGLDTLTYPGDSPPRLERTDSIALGGSWNATHLGLSAHCGTHLDAPCHFIDGGASIDALPLERFMLPAVVIDCGGAECVTAEHVRSAGLEEGMAALFRTRNGLLARDVFSEGYAYISPAAAQALVDCGAALAGIDYLSVDPADSTDVPAHGILLGAGLVIMEDADLRAATPGRYTLVCFPLRLHDTEASPVRAVLVAG